MIALDTVAMIPYSVLIFIPPPEIVCLSERRVQPQPRQCVALSLSHALREHKTNSKWIFGVCSESSWVYIRPRMRLSAFASFEEDDGKE